jgi:uncharacterized protein (DUF58 family)
MIEGSTEHPVHDGALIFDRDTLQKLRRLRLVAKRIRPGIYKGEHRSVKHGSSIDFADYRNYVPGDDLRRLDWNVYARSLRPFIKLMEEEEDLAVHVLVDASGSMLWGQGDTQKFRYAIRLTAALSAIALYSRDRLMVARIRSSEVEEIHGPLLSELGLLPLLSNLEHWRASGTTDLNHALRRYALHSHRPGLTLVISDLLSPSGYLDGMRQLLRRRHNVVLLHLLTPDEIEPSLQGDLRFIDIETESALDISLDGGIRQLYRDRLDAWKGEIKSECHRRGSGYLFIRTDEPWDKIVLTGMRRAGIVA